MGNAHALTEWITDRLIAERDNGPSECRVKNKPITNVWRTTSDENDKFFLRTTHAPSTESAKTSDAS